MTTGKNKNITQSQAGGKVGGCQAYDPQNGGNTYCGDFASLIDLPRIG